MTTLVNIRIDENDKKEFTKLCNTLGLSVTTAINMFVKQSIREQRIPVDLVVRFPNSETMVVIENSRKGIGLSKAYDTVEDLMEALDAED
ncbi:MAG: type II toxin-antitoxin system RelB/DinJ family antitoxin [Lachnospiraceae bacterium]|nr:type II toxin-antitoxin system RelB/DinJ family antitoxin [Erysipelotrichaceae bacterium]MBR3397831.1 type II toxin-antitoxin system RelB/DinJ family antitoxin [Lachnospiraceae bacterium]